MRILSTFGKSVFTLKSLAFLVGGFLFLSVDAAAQVTDTIYQKPSLNNGMPPSEVSPPVIIQEPVKPKPETEEKEKVEVKTETYEEPVPFKDRFFTGGGFGLAFGDYTNVQLAPILGYKLTDWFAGGIGLTYIYVGDRFYSDNYLGKKVFLQGMVYKGIFAHMEYETFSRLGERGSADALLGGAGYRQMVSNKVGIDLLLLLNLNQNAQAVYVDPFVYRFGFYIEI